MIGRKPFERLIPNRAGMGALPAHHLPPDA
jgi:hypothetical protein